MRKLYLLLLFLGFTLVAAAKNNNGQDDMTFKILSFISLLIVLILAIRKLKSTDRK